jgi:uncharacterized protein YhbP (UPF0306 family)
MLDASTLCAVATTSPRGGVHINTAYFAWSPGFDLVWLSDPGAKHSHNLVAHPGVAIAVYDSTQVWGEPDRGIQLFGLARQVSGPIGKDAERLYARRFPAYARTDLGAYHFYRFRTGRMKLFDERALGAGVFVTVAVRAGRRLAWERTEIYTGRG